MTVTDPDNNLTKRTFDALNRLSTVTDPSPGGTTTTTYDAHDRPLTVTDPNGNVTSYTYDGFGDVIQQVSQDSGTTVYYYDPDANLTQKVDPSKATTNMTYDALDRMLTTTYPADTKENVKYTYDQSGHGFGIGRLTSLKDAAGTLSRSYDERGNVLSEKRVVGATTLQTGYTYDGASRVSSIAYPDSAVVTYTRDAMGRITKSSARAPGSGTVATVVANIAYEPFGPFVGLTYGNQVKEQRTYDLDYRLLGLTDTGRAAVQNLTYGYDPANNVLSITDMANSGNSQVFQLRPAESPDHRLRGYGSLSWTYDPLGNRLTQTQRSTLTQYTYGPGNRLASTTSGGVTQTVGYTAAGNINSSNPALGLVTSLTYDQANRLSIADGSGMPLGSYTYDAFGHRLQKATTSPVTLYQYDLSGNLLEETNTISGAQADYIYLNGCPVSTITPSTGALSFLHDDRLCTPQLATGSGQSTVWSAGGYQPFGQTGTVTGSITQNLRLPGQYFDAELGWNHNGFRDYVPNLGRYVESDPIGLAGGLNPYRYANANPGKFTDPTGRDVPGVVVGLLYGGFSAYYGASTIPNATPADIAIATALGAITGGALGSVLPPGAVLQAAVVNGFIGSAADAIGQGYALYVEGGTFNRSENVGAGLGAFISGAEGAYLTCKAATRLGPWAANLLGQLPGMIPAAMGGPLGAQLNQDDQTLSVNVNMTGATPAEIQQLLDYITAGQDDPDPIFSHGVTGTIIVYEAIPVPLSSHPNQ